MGLSTLCACGRVSTWGDVTSASFDNKAADIKGPVTAEEVASHFLVFVHTQTQHTHGVWCVYVCDLAFFSLQFNLPHLSHLCIWVEFMFQSISAPLCVGKFQPAWTSSCSVTSSRQWGELGRLKIAPGSFSDTSQNISAHESSSPSLPPPLSNCSLSQSFRKWNKIFHLSLQINIESVYQWSTFFSNVYVKHCFIECYPLKYKQ